MRCEVMIEKGRHDVSSAEGSASTASGTTDLVLHGIRSRPNKVSNTAEERSNPFYDDVNGKEESAERVQVPPVYCLTDKLWGGKRWTQGLSHDGKGRSLLRCTYGEKDGEEVEYDVVHGVLGEG